MIDTRCGSSELTQASIPTFSTCAVAGRPWGVASHPEEPSNSWETVLAARGVLFEFGTAEAAATEPTTCKGDAPPVESTPAPDSPKRYQATVWTAASASVPVNGSARASMQAICTRQEGLAARRPRWWTSRGFCKAADEASLSAHGPRLTTSHAAPWVGPPDAGGACSTRGRSL